MSIDLNTILLHINTIKIVMFTSMKSQPVGHVWLVGAGPGAHDLITVRGMNLLKRAEVVIHDDLSGQDLLDYCSSECELIYVGKRAGQNHVPQAEINWLMIAHAKAGKQVVRLKGGDPSVFARMGEELAALRSEDILYDIVPGVTAACAAAAASGISLTQRGIASAVIFATAHECSEKSGLTLDWEALTKTGASLCLYMGTRKLASLAEHLIAKGKKETTPLLVVSHACRKNQAIRSGTLSDAKRLASEAEGDVAMIVIGEVAASYVQLSHVHAPLAEAVEA
jgi:uroporphyrin-III C-methyltransferase